MATRIIEYGGTGKHRTGYPIVPADMFLARQAAMTATASSVASTAVGASTSLVCVQSDEQIYCEIDNSAAPTATTDSYRIAAGGEQWFCITAGKGAKVAIRT